MLEGGACEHILVDGNEEHTEPPADTTTTTIGDADIVIPDNATDAGAVMCRQAKLKVALLLVLLLVLQLLMLLSSLRFLLLMLLPLQHHLRSKF